MARRTIFIRPRLQIKYLISSLLVVCLTALAVYYVFWSSLITSPGLDSLSAGEMRALQYAYQTSFVWVVLIILIAIGFLSIFYFHRLVGPIYVFGKIVKALAAGDLTAAMHTHKNDELKDLATETDDASFSWRTMKFPQDLPRLASMTEIVAGATRLRGALCAACGTPITSQPSARDRCGSSGGKPQSCPSGA